MKTILRQISAIPQRQLRLRNLLTLFLITAGLPGLHAQEEAINAETNRLLSEQGELVHFFSEAEDLQLLPALAFSEDIKTDMIGLQPKIGGEILYRQELPASLAESSTAERDLHIYNTMRMISLMQGIEYYSRSREKMRLLFEESYFVDKFKSKTPLPDMPVKSIPAHQSLVCFQKDLSFGTNYYRLDYSFASSVSRLYYSNLDTMFYKKLIKAVAPEKMIIELMVFIEQDMLYVYGIFGASVPGLLGMDEKAKGSFYERLKAIRNWYLATL
ncbi:MAG: hypothetical protein JW874_09800 [Spirochaetales bacterium]|nr:hypothetical protein [Spirochaetales bacterium]